MTFADLTDDMDAMIMSSLNDGLGDYFDSAGTLVAQGIELMIDKNLQRVGPDGVFMSEAVGVTWRKQALPVVIRGGFFVFGPRRYVVEETIQDDGHMLTAACMEMP